MPAGGFERSLRRNRDFNLLWAGQILSDLGTRIAGIATPLLVLAITGSPARAGIAAFVETIPLLFLTLPAGALVDRWDRKRLMIICDAARCLAFTSLVVALLAHEITFAQIVLVGLIDGTGFVFFSVAERSALTRLVIEAELPSALARNQTREYGALLAGQPLGGALFALSRSAPFLFNAASYLASVVSLIFIRTDLRSKSSEAPQHLLREVRQGLAWFWQQSFIRTTSFLVTGSDFTLNALYLVVIVLAKERGASSTLIGLMFAFLGVGGILGTAVAPRLVQRLELNVVVIATIWLTTALLPLLIILPGRLTPGVIYGAMFFLHPTWNSAIGAYRIRVTPDEMQGRVQSISTLLSLGLVPFAFLLAGFLLQSLGTTRTVLTLLGLMTIVSLAAAASPSIRAAPRENSAKPETT